MITKWMLLDVSVWLKNSKKIQQASNFKYRLSLDVSVLPNKDTTEM
jgi:hypothetical protein